jgi:hypothetical protein
MLLKVYIVDIVDDPMVGQIIDGDTNKNHTILLVTVVVAVVVVGMVQMKRDNRSLGIDMV